MLRIGSIDGSNSTLKGIGGQREEGGHLIKNAKTRLLPKEHFRNELNYPNCVFFL